MSYTIRLACLQRNLLDYYSGVDNVIDNAAAAFVEEAMSRKVSSKGSCPYLARHLYSSLLQAGQRSESNANAKLA